MQETPGRRQGFGMRSAGGRGVVAVEDPASHNLRYYLSQPNLQSGGLLHGVVDVYERIEREESTFPYEIVEVAVHGVNEL